MPCGDHSTPQFPLTEMAADWLPRSPIGPSIMGSYPPATRIGDQPAAPLIVSSSTTVPDPGSGVMVWCQECGEFYQGGCWRHPLPVTTASPALAFGWECPRCFTIHAPWVATCYCPGPTVTTIEAAPCGPLEEPSPAWRRFLAGRRQGGPRG